MNVSLEYLGEKTFKANTAKSSYVLDCKEITPVEYFATGIVGCTGIDLIAVVSKLKTVLAGRAALNTFCYNPVKSQTG